MNIELHWSAAPGLLSRAWAPLGALCAPRPCLRCFPVTVTHAEAGLSGENSGGPAGPARGGLPFLLGKRPATRARAAGWPWGWGL